MLKKGFQLFSESSYIALKKEIEITAYTSSPLALTMEFPLMHLKRAVLTGNIFSLRSLRRFPYKFGAETTQRKLLHFLVVGLFILKRKLIKSYVVTVILFCCMLPVRYSETKRKSELKKEH